MKKKRRVTKLTWAISGLAFMVAAEVSFQFSGMVDSESSRLAVLALLPFSIYVVWRFHINPYVSFFDSYLCINNVFFVYKVPYRMISECRGVRSLTVVVDGWGAIPVSAFDATVLGRRSRDVIAGEIMGRRDVSRSDFSVRFLRTATTGIPEFVGIGIFLMLLLAATIV